MSSYDAWKLATPEWYDWPDPEEEPEEEPKHDEDAPMIPTYQAFKKPYWSYNRSF